MDSVSGIVQNSEVISRLASVGELAAGVAHEIRNPLTSVKGLLQLLREKCEYQHWDIIFAELDQAISTTQSLLSVSKPSLQSELASDFSLCIELENVLSLFQHNTYTISFERIWFDKATRIHAKRNQIKQALFNLIKNACEAIEANSTVSGVVTIEHRRIGEQACLTIRDNGVGISADILSRLGTPFLTTKPNGTGMGLTQVYSVLHDNQATIEVTSTPGEGTAFTMFFPVSMRYTTDNGGIVRLKNVQLRQSPDVRDFFRLNQKEFSELLEQEAQTTFQIVSQSNVVTKDDLLEHAHQITELIHDGLTQDIIELAQERGITWAKSDIPIISKMEWFYALRKVIWYFLQQFYADKEMDAFTVFEIADRTSQALDSFIVHFNVSFTKYREGVLNAQKAMIEELSVPIIPLLDSIGVLPVVGTLDTNRLRTIEERLLEQLENRNMNKIFIDLSAAIVTDTFEVNALDRVLTGIGLLGCEAVLTGVNAKLVRHLLNSDREFVNRISVEASLQQALQKALQYKIAE